MVCVPAVLIVTIGGTRDEVDSGWNVAWCHLCESDRLGAGFWLVSPVRVSIIGTS